MAGWWYVTIIGTTIAVANMILSSSSRPSLTSSSSSSEWLACARERDQFHRRAKSFHVGRAPRRWQSWSPPRAQSPGLCRRGQGRENYDDTYIKHIEAQNVLKRWMMIRLAIGNLLCAQVVADKPARAIRDHLWKNNQWTASASCSQIPLLQIWLCSPRKGHHWEQIWCWRRSNTRSPHPQRQQQSCTPENSVFATFVSSASSSVDKRQQ